MSTKRTLVTGGGGFLGSWLCEKLLEKGHEVICVDNFFTGAKRNIYHLLDNPKFELLRHDVTMPLYIEVDQIYNLTCPASPVHYQRDPIQTVKTCVHGAINMLGLAKRLKIPILQASTSEVYGDPSVHPQVEEYWGNVNPVGLRSCYDEGKRCAETLFYSCRLQSDLGIKIVRIFNTYGPRMRPKDGRIVPAFCCQALKGDPITVFGDGTQTRSFCFVSDLIDGIYRLMMSDHADPVNIGNPRELTVMDFAHTIRELTRSAAPIIHKPLPVDDPKVRQPDISKARKLLGWEPKMPLEEGLQLTIDYFAQLIQKGVV